MENKQSQSKVAALLRKPTDTNVTPTVSPKPQSSPESAELLGEIFSLMKKSREEEIKHREQLKNLEESLKEKEKTKNELLAEAIQGKKEEKKKPVKKQELKRKKKKKEKSFDYPGGLAGVLTDVVAATVLFKAWKKQSEMPEEAESEEVKTEEMKKEGVKAEKPKVSATPVTPDVTPPSEKPTPQVTTTPPKVPSASKVPQAEVPKEMTGKAKVFGDALRSMGITSLPAIQAIIATSAKESGLDPKSKEAGANAWSNTLKSRGIGYIYNKFPQLGPNGRMANKLNMPNGVSQEYLQGVLNKGDEAWFSLAYDGLSTNSKPGDGYLYRGRGFIQITGRSIYRNIGKIIDVDLESNPDAITQDFNTASKAAGAYIINSIGGPQKGLAALNSMTDYNQALKVVIGNVASGGLGADSARVEAAYTTSKLAATNVGQLEAAKKYTSLASSYGGSADMVPGTSKDISVASSQNKDLKDQAKKDKSTQTTNVASTTETGNVAQKPQPDKYDDRPIYLRKTQGAA